MDNPYSPPASASLTPSKIKLYSPGQVAWASFLGSPIAGAILMALNFRRLTDFKSANYTLVCGLMGTCLLFVLAFFLPENVPNAVLPAIYVYTMYQCAKEFQGKVIKNRLAIDGVKGSGWFATGVGILCMILFLVFVFAVLIALPEAWLGEE